MYAVIETGGKQLRVEEGMEIYVEKLDVEEGSTVEFDKVNFVSGDSLKIGAPYVDGAIVTCEVVKHGKQKKILIFKYKAKKNKWNLDMTLL